MRSLNISESDLTPTKHRIIGITATSLQVIGSLKLAIRYRDRTTRQMVYVSNAVKGLFLSETALKELNIVHAEFPEVLPPSCSEASTTLHQAHPVPPSTNRHDCQTSEDADCRCIPRAPPPDRPTVLPFNPSVENVPALEKWLLKNFESSAFNTCTHQPLQTMTGAPVTIQFKKEASPSAVHTPIPVPHHWKAEVKAGLDRDVRLGIIEPVPQGTPTEWCSRMVVVPKKNGTPRRTVDLQRLNQATLRETHHTPTPFNLVSTVPPGSVKTVCDAWNGYHSLDLAAESRNATSFITEWGRFRYRRAPMGLHTSGDAYTRRFDDITSDVTRSVRCVDDTLLWDDSIEDAFWHAFDYLHLCSSNGLVFNQQKFSFGRTTMEFAGFEVTPDGYRPPKRILAAIRDFPTPTNITDIRSWFGLVNQVAYAFAQSKVMEPFRELLASKTKRVFFWDETMGRIFEKAKEEIVRLIQEGVRAFEMERETCLSTDWSKSGLGFILSQKHCRCKEITPNCGQGHWKLVLAGSRFTKEAESRYAPIEGEALAVSYGLQCCRMFVLGHPNLTVAVDHKPLISILNDRALDTIANPRLIRIKEKTLMFKFEIIHVAGVSNAAPDAASRYPQRTSEETRECESQSLATHQKPIPSVSTKEVDETAACDEECLGLLNTIIDGFPDLKDSLPERLKQYWPMRDDLYVIGNTIFRGRKMLIPRPLRRRILEGLHSAHQGVTSMMSHARERFFWPGLNADIRQTRAQCKQCMQNAPSQRSEPLAMTPDPEYPFQQVAADLCDLEGHKFLVYADRYSGWVQGAKLSSCTFRNVSQHLINWFATFGVPEEMSTDGGPPFNSHDYDEFLRTWNVHKRLSSAHYPQSNGRAEAAVKTTKRILLGNINPMTGELDTNTAAAAILAHRNTPNQMTGVSPAVTLFGHPIRDHLPTHPMRLRQEWEEIYDARENALAKRHIRTMEPTREEEMPPLSIGDTVSIQNQSGNKPGRWDNTGTVTEALPFRQYRVLVDGSRRITLRNRRFLRKIDPICRNPDYIRETMGQPRPPATTTNDEPAPPVVTAQPDEPKPPPLPAPIADPTLMPQPAADPTPAVTPASPHVQRTPPRVQRTPIIMPMEQHRAGAPGPRHSIRKEYPLRNRQSADKLNL